MNSYILSTDTIIKNFDHIGFNKIEDDLFRHITIARLAYPTSKLKTADYLYRYRGIKIEVTAIYRFLDKLAGTYKEEVERIAFEYTKETLKSISVIFYDMTTLHFETEDEDDLRKIGFSKDGKGFAIKKPDGMRLAITYSEKRHKKDASNRERGLKKLRRRVKTGRLTKESINNRGYNKFLVLKGKVDVEIDESKVKEGGHWDGLKGYITNTHLSPKKIAENYRHLWQIEKAFRISKTDLKIRPIRHRLKNRIEAHICIAFVAYTIYKELERLLLKHGVGFSPKRAAELTHNMYELEYILPHSKRKEKTLLRIGGNFHQNIHNLICQK